MKRTSLFLKPRMVGKRFEEHSIPFELLKDLSVLEEMIIEIAKWLYLQDHSARKRTPRGFTDGISLQLSNVEEGSAVPNINLSVSSNDMFPQNLSYFEKARETFINVIDAAANSEDFHQHLPGNLLGMFDRFGRSLLEDELIEFRPESQSRKAKFDLSVRRKLILASQVQALTDSVTLTGTIPEVDQEKMSFTIALVSGNRISAPMSFQHKPIIMDVFERYGDNAKVTIEGVGRYTRLGRLEVIESIEHIISLEQNDVFARIEELSILENGWLDGKGLAPEREFLKWLSDCFSTAYDESLPWPYLFPTPEGGVLAEWDLANNDVSLEIDPKSKIGFYHVLNMINSSDLACEISLDEDAGWADLNGKLSELREQNNEE
ncbi:hypothetical protein PU683_05800 [Kosakonia cowanii]|uniref:hypothetical protein n=1 Tax=Kosakonia cowanii TaxID=208223 RepID=UPI0023FA4285|nr:hypothetical protein [Kosakonia cowanii]MDF7759044.1 hypothetical protein [Kosakonia cowanii]